MTTIISDEAVNIALNTWLGGVPAWRNNATERLRTEMRAALTAAAHHLASVRVNVDEIVQPLEDIHAPGGLCRWTDVATAIGEVRRALSALEPSAARELALEEILREVDEVERKVWAWSGSAFLNNELEGAEDADCKTELYRELCGIGNTMHWLRTKICALSSPDHIADAGKVEGDGWRPIESAPKDGTIVLLGWNDPDIEEIGAVAGWYESGPADKCWYDQYHEPVTATHWMPLRPFPAAPASEGAE